MDIAIGSAVPANTLNINCVLFLLSSIQHLCGSPCGAVVIVVVAVSVARSSRVYLRLLRLAASLPTGYSVINNTIFLVGSAKVIIYAGIFAG
jgi:hypothetical protein